MKIILIIGANRGYGLELTKVFASDGWQVFAACRNPDDFPTSQVDGAVKAVELDLLSQDSIRALPGQVDDQKIDVLINNAGVFDAKDAQSRTEEQDMQSLTRIYQVNSIAPRLVAEALLPNLNRSDDPQVINISSFMSSFGEVNSFNLGHWPYGASKAAMNYSMLAFANQNPSVKAGFIHPGWMQTDMGGSGANTDPSESAQRLHDLIVNGQIIANKLTDTSANPIPF